MNRKFLDALAGRNTGRPPVWIMRQAGRYLPSYQALRRKHTLYDLFFTPKLAAQATLLPIQDLGFDAAILFSDITVIAKALGSSLDFADGVGPIVSPLLDPNHLPQSFDVEPLMPIAEAIRLCKPSLDVPILGFCGGPFTVASYLIETKGGHELPLTKRWMVRDPASFHRLLALLTDATIAYLDLQIDAGVDAIQIFESHAHVLSAPHLRAVCLPYHERLIRHVQSRQIPAISFFRGSSLHIADIAAMKPNGIGCDWQRPLSQLRQSVGPAMALQGNLDPDLLFAPLPEIASHTQELLDSMKGDPAFILNLGHGIKPETPVESVRYLVSLVKNNK